jgi:hypothetical protein
MSDDVLNEKKRANSTSHRTAKKTIKGTDGV